MLFQTPEFAILLAATLLLFSLTRNKARLRVLLMASLVFYGFSGPIDTIVFIAVIVTTFTVAKKLHKAGSVPLLVGLLILLFSNLGVFKYGGFLYDNVNLVMGSLGLPLLVKRPELWLPLGISFYTFQLVAYSVDVHRGTIECSQDLTEFMVYIMFFGQLVAGPIMRGKDFLPQLQGNLHTSWGDLREAAYHIIRGLVKKVILADALSSLVTPMFANPETLNHASVWLAAYLFAFQIYLDFSAYTDIGVGLGRLFGLRLSANFLTPYLTANPSEFWTHWHVTLSTWLKDYLYIPLGGNRCSHGRSNINLLLTMLLGGIWHGASWTFFAWGAYQGLLLIAHKEWTRTVGRSYSIPRGWSVFLNFQVMALGWMIFRAGSLRDVSRLWAQAFDFSQVSTWGAHILLLVAVLGLYALHLLERLLDDNRQAITSRWRDVPTPLRGLAYALVVFVVILSFRPAQSFIYFRF